MGDKHEYETAHVEDVSDYDINSDVAQLQNRINFGT